MTSLTVDELRQLVPPFEAVFQAQMAQWRLDGQPRTVLRYTTYTTSCHGRGSTRSAGAYAHPFQLGQQQGMSSTRSLMMLSLSAMPRAYHDVRDRSKFERTVRDE